MPKPNQSITENFTVHSGTNALANADSLPTGTLVVNGADNAATVTVTNTATGKYKAAVTLPSDLVAGDRVQIFIAATVSGVASGAYIWEDEIDTKRTSELHDLDAGAQMDLIDTPNTTAVAAFVTAIWSVLTSALTTVGSVGKRIVDYLDAAISSRSTYDGSDTSGVTSLLSRLTASRAGYLDNLNIGENVAGASAVTAIQNNTRVIRSVPASIEVPDVGTDTRRIELFLYDSQGNMEAPDTAPTIALVNQGGTDLSSRLDSTTMAFVSTGRYRAVYTATAGDDLEQLNWTFSVTEGGQTRTYPNTTELVDVSQVGFTSADRANLGLILNDTDEVQTELANGGRTDLLIDSIITAIGSLNDLDATEIRAALGLGSANLDTQLSALSSAIGAINSLDATGLRAAVGLASANLDTQLGNILAVATLLRKLKTGQVIDKVDVPGTLQVIDPDDDVTPIADVVLRTTSPYQRVTVL